MDVDFADNYFTFEFPFGITLCTTCRGVSIEGCYRRPQVGAPPAGLAPRAMSRIPAQYAFGLISVLDC